MQGSNVIRVVDQKLKKVLGVIVSAYLVRGWSEQ